MMELRIKMILTMKTYMDMYMYENESELFLLLRSPSSGTEAPLKGLGLGPVRAPRDPKGSDRSKGPLCVLVSA